MGICGNLREFARIWINTMLGGIYFVNPLRLLFGVHLVQPHILHLSVCGLHLDLALVPESGG